MKEDKRKKLLLILAITQWINVFLIGIVILLRWCNH